MSDQWVFDLFWATLPLQVQVLATAAGILLWHRWARKRVALAVKIAQGKRGQP